MDYLDMLKEQIAEASELVKFPLAKPLEYTAHSPYKSVSVRVIEVYEWPDDSLIAYWIPNAAYSVQVNIADITDVADICHKIAKDVEFGRRIYWNHMGYQAIKVLSAP